MNVKNLEQGAVPFILVTEAQLRQVAEDGARSVLERFGIKTDEVKEKFHSQDKSEYRPLAYWMERLGVNRSTMWRWEKDGLITGKRMGKKIYFCQRDFDAMFAARGITKM